MPLVAQGEAPYSTADGIITVVEKHRSVGLPAPIDTALLIRLGVAESLVPRTLKSLRLLDLIDNKGEISEQLDLIGKTPPAELQDRLAEWIRAVYAPVFQVTDPATATPADLENAFYGFSPRGQLARMISCFTGLCVYAGIIEKAPAKKAGPKPGGGVSKRAAGKKAVDRFLEQKGDKTLDELESSDVTKEKVETASTLDTQRQRYLDLLISKAEAKDAPEADLYDRIERVLGVPPAGGGS